MYFLSSWHLYAPMIQNRVFLHKTVLAENCGQPFLFRVVDCHERIMKD